jgi:hypothetical protein
VLARKRDQIRAQLTATEKEIERPQVQIRLLQRAMWRSANCCRDVLGRETGS